MHHNHFLYITTLFPQGQKTINFKKQKFGWQISFPSPWLILRNHQKLVPPKTFMAKKNWFPPPASKISIRSPPPPWIQEGEDTMGILWLILKKSCSTDHFLKKLLCTLRLFFDKKHNSSDNVLKHGILWLFLKKPCMTINF